MVTAFFAVIEELWRDFLRGCIRQMSGWSPSG